MKNTTEQNPIKVPEVIMFFWIIKAAATTLGETGGDAVSHLPRCWSSSWHALWCFRRKQQARAIES